MFEKIVRKSTKNRKLAGERPKKNYQTFLVFCSILLLSAIIVPIAVFAQWAEPGQFPPQYNAGGEIPSFLTGGSIYQQKLGSLLLGNSGGSSKFCLNTSPDDGANDATKCVSSWDQALGLAGHFLHLSTVAPNGNLYPGNYIVQDIGYIRIKANSANNQLYSLNLEAHPTLADSRALFAIDPAGVDTIYAAYLSGRVRIDNVAHNTKLCLNDTIDYSDVSNGKGCIGSWADVLVPPGYIGLVNLQTGPSYIAQSGKTVVNGVGFMGTAVAGTTAGLNRSLTCGDGICSADTFSAGILSAETFGNCPSDCGTSGLPDFKVTPWVDSNRIEITGRAQQSGVPYQLLIVRRTDAAPIFQPQQGSKYSTGMVFGSGANAETIILSATSLDGYIVPYYDTGLGHANTYYYQAWQGNSYPRYGYPGVAQTGSPGATAFNLRVSLSPSRGLVSASYGGGPGADGIACPTNCNELYAANASVTIYVDAVQPGYTFSGWGGACAGTDPNADCTLIMNGPKNVTAFFVLE